MPLIQAVQKEKPFKQWILKRPTRLIVFSFLFLILLGTVLLTLPFAAADGTWTHPFVALFTATSASCVTGLILRDTATHWSGFGQAVILFLIQLGGLGLATITSFFLSFRPLRKSWKLQELASESTAMTSREELWRFVRHIIGLTFGLELIGALLYMTTYVPQGGKFGIWKSVFQSISAFCNAGFDLNGGGAAGPFSSLVHYNQSFLILGVTSFLIIAGGLGFLVWHNLFELARKRRNNLSFHARLALGTTGIFLLVGCVVFLILEFNNTRLNALGNLPTGKKVLNAFFHSVSCRTAGFNAVDMGNLTPASKFFSCILMFIGAQPGGTGGGIKITTFAIVLAIIVASMRQQDQPTLVRHRLASALTMRAVTIFALGFAVLLTGTFLIAAFERAALAAGQFAFIDILFESASAFGTVGLTSIGTARLTVPSQVILAVMMFLGRVGPVSFALSIVKDSDYASDVLPEGRILIG